MPLRPAAELFSLDICARSLRAPLPRGHGSVELLGGGDGLGSDIDELAHAAAIAEFHDAADFREQGVVTAPADVFARLDAGAALANDDRTARHRLASEHFHAQPLRVGIAPVLGTA